MKRVDLYSIKGFEFNLGDKVVWNKKIFKECPFEVDEPKEVDETSFGTLVGVKGVRMWCNWWEIVPTNIFNKPIYWIKFYYWYYTRFKKL